MESDLLEIPRMLLIGSSGRNRGKTTLASALIRHWTDQYPVIGLKVTTIRERDGLCPRGGAGCGVCANLQSNYELIQETNDRVAKDTARLLAAGAAKVYWLKVLKNHLQEGIKAFEAQASAEQLIICESNSLRQVVKPGGFIMLHNPENDAPKPSALAVMGQADLVVADGFAGNLERIIDQITIVTGQPGLAVKVTPDGNFGCNEERRADHGLCRSECLN